MIRPHALGRFPDAAAGERAASGDALLPRQLAEHAAGLRQAWRSRSGPARRPQRELRAGADGAAHARRRRRLHAARRHRGRARVHRLDDRPSARGCALRLPVGDPRLRRQGGARARTIQVGGERDGEAHARHARPASLDRALSRRQAGAPVRGRRSAARAGRARGRPLPGHRRRHPRHAARDLRVARVPGARHARRQDQEADGVRGRARCARWAPRPTPGAPRRSRAPAPRSARASTRRSRPPAIPIAPRPGSIPARCWRG